VGREKRDGTSFYLVIPFSKRRIWENGERRAEPRGEGEIRPYQIWVNNVGRDGRGRRGRGGGGLRGEIGIDRKRASVCEHRNSVQVTGEGPYAKGLLVKHGGNH